MAERSDVSTSVSDTFRLPTSVGEVSLRATPGLAPPQPPYAFAIRAPEGQVLAEAELAQDDLARTRSTWRAWMRAATLFVLALTVLLGVAPILEARRHALTMGAVAATTAVLVGMLGVARALMGVASGPLSGTDRKSVV